MIIFLPIKYGPTRKRDMRRLRHKPSATVHHINVPSSSYSEAYRLYLEAGKIDEDYSRLDDAIELYNRALKADPTLHIALTNLGNCYFRKREPETAIHCYQMALASDPRQPEALYNLGYIWLEKGYPLRAIPLLQRAREAGMGLDAVFNLAMAFEACNAPERAEPLWKEYVAEASSDDAWADVARSHIRESTVAR